MIVVSGTPGTGKTTLAKEISTRYDLPYVDVNEIIKKDRLSEGFDEENECVRIDTAQCSDCGVCVHVCPKKAIQPVN